MSNDWMDGVVKIWYIVELCTITTAEVYVEEVGNKKRNRLLLRFLNCSVYKTRRSDDENLLLFKTIRWIRARMRCKKLTVKMRADIFISKKKNTACNHPTNIVQVVHSVFLLFIWKCEQTIVVNMSQRMLTVKKWMFTLCYSVILPKAWRREKELTSRLLLMLIVDNEILIFF